MNCLVFYLLFIVSLFVKNQADDYTFSKEEFNAAAATPREFVSPLRLAAGDNFWDFSSRMDERKVGQTITFSQPSNSVYGRPDFYLEASASSDLAVTYVGNNAEVATVSGDGLVSIKGAGLVTITASQNGDARYDPAPNVSRQLRVDKAAQTITFDRPEIKTYGVGDFYLGATASSGLTVFYVCENPAIAAVSPIGAVTIAGAGTTVITASQGGNANYEAAVSNAQTLTVNKGEQRIFFAQPMAKFYGDEGFNLGAWASSGLPITYVSSRNASVAVSAIGLATIASVGTVSITASQSGNANYHSAAEVTRALTVSRGRQIITFPPPSNKQYGDASFNVGAAVSSGLPLSYASSHTGVAAISTSGVVTLTGVGETILTVSQIGDGNYHAADRVHHPLRVSRGRQVISFDALPTKDTGEAPFELTGSASSGLALTYISSNPSVAAVHGNRVTLVALGTTFITASQDGNANYEAATRVRQELAVIGKHNQVITFAPPAAKRYGAVDFNLGASASSGLAVSYVSANTEVAAVSATGAVTIVGVGETHITASQSGNTSYNPAPVIVHRLAVGRGEQTITFAPPAVKDYGSEDFNLDAAASSALPLTYVSENVAVAVVSSAGLVAIVGVGSTNIHVSQVGNVNYNAASSVTRTLTVNRGTQTITYVQPIGKHYGDEDFDLGATVSSDLPVTYRSNTPAASISANGTVTIVGIGTASITASQAGNESYNSAEPVTRTFMVNRGNQRISFPPLTARSVNEGSFELTAVASSDLPISYTSSNLLVAVVSNSRVSIIGLGSTIITASQVGDNFYNRAASVSQELVVNNCLSQTITFTPPASKTYGEASFTLEAASSSNLPVSFSGDDDAVATVTPDGVVAITGGGTMNIMASQVGNAVYNAATSGARVFRVERANQTIHFAELEARTYGNPAFALQASASSGLAVTYSGDNDLAATVSAQGTVTLVGAGSVNITASQVGNANYNPSNDLTNVLTVDRGNQIITFPLLAAKHYGDPSFHLAAVSSAGLPITFTGNNSSVAVVSDLGNVTILASGTVAITAEQEGNALYNAAPDIVRTLVINKANQQITFAPLAEQAYDHEEFDLTATASSDLPVTYSATNQAVAVVSASGHVSIVGVGRVAIAAMQGGNSDYDPAAQVVHTLVVKKGIQTITFTPLEARSLSAGNFQLSATASSGLPIIFSSSDPAVAVVSESAVTALDAGAITITASQPGNHLYDPASNVEQELVIIDRALQTITIDEVSPTVLFGDPGFCVRATSSSGLSLAFEGNNSEVAAVSPTGDVSIVGAGSMLLWASQAGNSAYRSARSETRSLVVNKAHQTISFSPLPNPLPAIGRAFTLNATASSGLIVTYKSSNTKAFVISGNNVQIVGAGRGYIEASQVGNRNYNPAAEVTLPFEVSRMAQTLSFSPLPNKPLGSSPFRLTATASSGLPVLYASSNASVATVQRDRVTIVGTGRTTITATQQGNNRYSPALGIAQPLVVVAPIVPAKQRQRISFEPLQDRAAGSSNFTLRATSTSQLAVSFTGNEKVSITGDRVTLIRPGIAVIKANQSGDRIYEEAEEVRQSFCINPVAPIITGNNNVLTSSSAVGNQWFKDDVPIEGATRETYRVKEKGYYSARVTIESCVGARSTSRDFFMTGDRRSQGYYFYPNPIQNQLTIELPAGENARITLFGLEGKLLQAIEARGKTQLDMRWFASGIYVLKIESAEKSICQKVIKQ